jgi:DNA-binding transcriptional ArsR family regulator
LTGIAEMSYYMRSTAYMDIRTQIKRSSMREIGRVFKVLEDGTKLRILNLLMEREYCVCEVVQALEIF